MNPIFERRVEKLDETFKGIMESSPVNRSTLPKKGGVYLFSEGPKHLYVGRTKDLRRRIGHHSNPSSKDAPFAFRLAREATGRLKATFTRSGSRKELLKDPKFVNAFSMAKRRVGRMDVRIGVEEDAIGQALLEIYVATALDTPYNDFDTH